MPDDFDEEHIYRPEESAGKFVMRIAQEETATVDGRMFSAGAISWREPPIPLMMIRENDPTLGGGHKGSSAIGVITDMWKEVDDDGAATVFGRGYFSSDEAGQLGKQLIQEGVISGVSADVGGAVVEELEAQDDGLVRRIIRRGEIVAVTALSIPSFDATKISVTAAASPDETWRPAQAWFGDPKLAKPTPITVTADGRIFGHAALWGTCHLGYKDRCITPPKSRSNYEFFNVGSVIADSGDEVSVGRLTAGTNHAAIEFGARPAKEHYDNTGFAAAYVHAGEDAHGIWFAGSVAPSATHAQIATIRAASVSGDWRSINGSLEMVGILAVNTPGFPIPKARAGLVAGAQVSLIASGLCACEGDEDDETEEGTAELDGATVVIDLGDADIRVVDELAARPAVDVAEPAAADDTVVEPPLCSECVDCVENCEGCDECIDDSDPEAELAARLRMVDVQMMDFKLNKLPPVFAAWIGLNKFGAKKTKKLSAGPPPAK